MLDATMTIEQTMVERGADRVRTHNTRAAERGQASDQHGMMALVRNYVDDLALAIAEKLVAEEARAGATTRFFMLAGHMDPGVLALLSLRIALDFAPSNPPLTRVARALGRAVEDEQRLGVIQAEAPGLYKAQSTKMRRRGAGVAHMRATWSAQAKSAGIEIPRWNQSDSLIVGVALIDILLSNTPLFETSFQPVARNRSQYFFRLTPAAIQWASARDAALSQARPFFLPTDTPPVPWPGVTGGGYRPPILPLPLVKVAPPEHRDLLANASMEPTLKAINAIQATPWRINSRVLSVMRQAVEAGATLPLIPSQEEEPLPPRPHNIDTDQEVLRTWRYAARMVHERRLKARSEAFEFHRLVNTAGDLEDRTIWFPHQLDFRGRVYAVPSLLTPQGRDEARALLEFDERLPVSTDEQRGWASINGANLWGDDKLPLQDRAKWADSRLDFIRAVASDPLSVRDWTQADKPWSFLAWCMDWVNIENTGTTAFPVALDGSCNGIQHYSAMLRDAVGGAAVNLTPSAQPQDIYAAVATRVTERLAAQAALGDWIAQGWLAFGITRKITKRPVMVLPYGGTRSSCGDYVALAVKEAIEGGTPNPFGDELRQAVNKLATEVWAAIAEVVVGARSAMRWLQTVAGLAARHDMPLLWTNPAGFPVYQRYPSLKVFQIKTKMRGSVLKLAAYREQPGIDQRRQALAVAPNFVHSMDAAALALTVNRCADDGITSFAMIHDSYGTHATRTPELARHLREAFVDMYERHDVLDELRQELVRMLPDGTEVPPPPPRGDLDIRQVLSSPYFFA